MTAITYTAKRNIAKGSFYVTGSDILADTLSDDFQSTTTNLTGLVSGNYIYVTGFSTWPNYGWHTVNGTSTATAISVTTNLTDEAAGATIEIQEYLHLYGVSYTIYTNPSVLNPWQRVESSESISQGGLEQSILRRVDRGYDFTSGLLTDAEFIYWREFTESVAAKESFTFDAFGIPGSSDNQETAILVGNPRFIRVSNVGWKVSIKIRTIA